MQLYNFKETQQLQENVISYRQKLCHLTQKVGYFSNFGKYTFVSKYREHKILSEVQLADKMQQQSIGTW